MSTSEGDAGLSKKDLALRNQAFGFSVFPVKNPEHRSDGDLQKEKEKGVEERKEPAVISLDEFKKAPISAERVEQLFAEEPDINYGIFCGKVSNNLVVLDADGDGYVRVLTNIIDDTQSGLRTAFLNTKVVTTGSGGRHYYFLLNDPMIETLGSRKIWIGDGDHNEVGIISNGKYVVGEGSRHPNGNTYKSNDKRPIPISWGEFIDIITRLASDPNSVIASYDSARDRQKQEQRTGTTNGYEGKSKKTPGLTVAEARLAKTFREFYDVGTRQDIWIGISGIFRRNLIPEIDATNACDNICDYLPEDEKKKRVDLMTASYEKKQIVEVAGWKWLEQFFKARNQDIKQEELEKKVDHKKQEILAVLFELKLEIIKRDNPWIIINQNPETYIVIRRNDNDFDIADNDRLVRVRRVQVLEVRRSRVNVGGNVDNLGRGDIKDLNYGDVLIDAVPKPGFEIVEDPLFGGLKYHMAWEYVNKITNEIDSTSFEKEPLRTKEEVEKYLKLETTWVRKTQRLGETVGAVIDAYKSDSNLIKYKREVGPTGFFYYDGKIWENKLNLIDDEKVSNQPQDWRDDIELVLQSAAIRAVEVIEEVQQKFFNGAEGRDWIRFSHYLKVHTIGPFDYVRKQLAITDQFGWVPRSDMSGIGGTGKTTFGELMCLMYGLDKHEYIISKRSYRSEARLNEILGKTTMVLTLEEPDFLANLDKPSVEDMISTLKDSVSKKSAFRMMADHKQVLEHYLAVVLLIHNSAPIIEDGMSRRFLNDQFEEVDKKDNTENPELQNQVREWKNYMMENANRIKNIGRFISLYVRTHPDVLKDYWYNSAWKIYEAMWYYAGGGDVSNTPPIWLKKTLLDLEAVDAGLTSTNTNAEVKDHYRSQLLTAVLRYTNDEFIHHGKAFENDRYQQTAYVSLENRLQWLAENNRLPGIFYIRQENKIFFQSSLKQILTSRYNVDSRAFPSLERFASYCGFACKPRKINQKPVRVAFADFQNFIKQLEFSSSTLEAEVEQNTK